MSGIEIAGLAFGVLPILIEVVKSYSSITKKVRTLRHYSKEVKSISERLRVYNGIFLNEIRLLLRLIETEEEVESMLEGADDDRWTSEHLNDKLRTVLRDSFDICRGIIEETKDSIDTMREELAKFDVLIDQKQKGETHKATIKRLKGAIKITFNKSGHERCLADLRDRNGELSALRSQIDAFQRQDERRGGACIQHRALPVELTSVRNASRKLHEALCGAWCCDDAAHVGHYAKLCIDVEVRAEVRLDLAISCHEPSTKERDRSLSDAPIWFYVQSISTSNAANGMKGTMLTTPVPRPALPLELMTACSANVLKNKSPPDSQQQSTSRKKIKHVHFVDNSCGSPAVTVPSTTLQALTSELNLRQTKNICRYMQQHYQAFGVKSNKRCIGYLETPKMYKHLFYLRDKDKPTTLRPTQSQKDSVYTIFDIMQYDAEDVLAVEDQLRLAHKTALALLQFNDTPWLPDRWRLRQLSYVGSRDFLDEGTLKTLHLNSQISAPAMAPMVGSAMDGIEQTAPIVSDADHHGINNTTLFFLGVALLEIAYWKPIEEQMTARDLKNEIFAARRLAAGRAPLGPVYQKIAQKCLQCNFGFGTKLENQSLQVAVYKDVVCELKDMIEKLTF